MCMRTSVPIQRQKSHQTPTPPGLAHWGTLLDFPADTLLSWHQATTDIFTLSLLCSPVSSTGLFYTCRCDSDTPPIHTMGGIGHAYEEAEREQQEMSTSFAGSDTDVIKLRKT